LATNREALEHGVEGVGQLLELVARALQGDPLVERVLRDAARCRRDLLQRAQHATRDEPPQQDRQQRHRGEGDGVLDAQAVQSVLGHLALDGAPQLVGRAGPHGHVVGRQVVAHEDVADGQQRGAGEQEDPCIEQGHAQADRRGWHQTR
jgi:hypothetical protein